MARRIIYALERRINNSGGPEHVQQSLQGQSLEPANYRFVSDDGTPIIYHVCGGGPLLVVGQPPGWGVGINYLPTGFQPMVDSDKVTFVVIQPRGTFPSGRPIDESRMSSKHMAEDIDALRRHLGQDTINVVGQSSGAAISLAYAELFPSRCAKLMLIGTYLIDWEGHDEHSEEELKKRENDPRFASAVECARNAENRTFLTDEDCTEYVAGIINLYFFDPETAVPDFTRTAGTFTVQSWPYLNSFKADALPEAAISNDLGKITADTLMFSGENDWVTGVEESKFAQQAIGPNAKLNVYSECGHFCWIDRKDQFFKDLMAFLDG
ncbi:hypothetical protein PT974_11160 [Cladobotryum mycophilum]|uniref:AB hydrolase-1 domain-containing protein n=1 Tax=Cladobotryum mycophilum TaxID=491253 RepID=A0ABR0S4F7_9HYPO